MKSPVGLLVPAAVQFGHGSQPDECSSLPRSSCHWLASHERRLPVGNESRDDGGNNRRAMKQHVGPSRLMRGRTRAMRGCTRKQQTLADHSSRVATEAARRAPYLRLYPRACNRSRSRRSDAWSRCIRSVDLDGASHDGVCRQAPKPDNSLGTTASNTLCVHPSPTQPHRPT
jgi:hypothetical protein